MTAITDTAGERLSYAQLKNRIDLETQKMRADGVRPGTRVAVLCEPSMDSVVAMLAALYTGGVYVPLDASLPASRHTDMMHICKLALLLCHPQIELRVQGRLEPFPDVRTFEMGFDVDHHSHVDNDQVKISVSPIATDPDSPAILLFTSGSAGKPKGILLTQANFINHVALKTHGMRLKRECVPQQSSFGFDMSLIQIFSALANGGRLVMAGKDINRDPVELASLMSRERVSMTIATPTEYLAWTNSAAVVLQKNTAWRFAFSGGEQVPRQLKTELSRLGLPCLSLTICHGPTEITAGATFQSITLAAEAKSNFSCLSAADSGAWSQYAAWKALPHYSICIIDAD